MKQATARRIFEEWNESTAAPEASSDSHADERNLAGTGLPTFLTSPHLGRKPMSEVLSAYCGKFAPVSPNSKGEVVLHG